MSDLLERLEARIMPEPNSGCWIWMGETVSKGYGRFEGKKAHRVSYEFHKGRIPIGMVVDHLCRNRLCVNPDHLEAVTSRENTIRGIGPTAINAKKAWCKNGHELTSDNVRIRFREGRERRECLTCQYQMVRNWKERQKAALSSEGHNGREAE